MLGTAAAAGRGRPRWMGYHVTFGTGQTLHLHVAAHGDYDTGVFAYYIIRRGERCGLRIVGSPLQLSLNVLAIYEKWAPSHTYVAYASATKEGRHANRLMPPLPAGSAVRPCRSGRVFWARWAEWVPSGRSGRGFGERGEAVQ